MKLTLDASVFVARLREEEAGHVEALGFFKRCDVRRVRLFAPVLLLAEVAGALSRLRGAARFGEVGIIRVFGQPRLRLRDIDQNLAEKAARLAARHSLRGADAVYLSVAQETQSILVTTDLELLQVQAGVIVQPRLRGSPASANQPRVRRPPPSANPKSCSRTAARICRLRPAIPRAGRAR